MSDNAGSGKRVVSERRRAQNLRAQKNYRERQKRHTQVLEDLLASGGLGSQQPAEPSSGPAVTAVALSNDFTSNEPQMSSKDVLARALGRLGGIEEQLRARIETGETSLEDIIKAGLETLSLQHLAEKPMPSEASSIPVLRTDRILIPSNKMRVHPSLLPEVYANNLSLKHFSTVAALRANAELLGISFQQLIDPKSGSLFYSKTFLPPETTELVLGERFQHIKPHLRPTAAQLKHPHRAYIDLFPCPTFRQRLVEALATDPPMIDESDLCRDFGNDGVICWGSHLSGSPGASGSGAPWDIRSWEAQPWFLKKWWFIVGGEEGMLFQQSRWWHEFRGDRLPYPW